MVHITVDHVTLVRENQGTSFGGMPARRSVQRYHQSIGGDDIGIGGMACSCEPISMQAIEMSPDGCFVVHGIVVWAHGPQWLRGWADTNISHI